MATLAPISTVVCPACGGRFACDPAGPCWCKAEAYRLPVPSAQTSGCLCPTCLRAAAEKER